MNTTVFNPAQLQVLEMMSFVDSPEALAELKRLFLTISPSKRKKKLTVCGRMEN